MAHETGGVSVGPGGPTDPRTTAWVLLATGLARRAGHEGAFEPFPHIDHVKRSLPTMLHEGKPVDSAANNLSLARVALQVWGRSADGIPLADPAVPEARTLADAWLARYNETTGQYGTRLNEHLFAVFAAWLFEPPTERFHRMVAFVEAAASDPVYAGGGDPYAFDAWWTGYARSALGPGPTNTTFEVHLESILDAHRHGSGGVIGFTSGTRPDASTTAAAILGWQAAGETATGERISGAVGYLCSIRKDNGAIPFSGDQDIARVKTTSEVVIALALVKAPVPR